MNHFIILIFFTFLFIANGYSTERCHESLSNDSVDIEQNHGQGQQPQNLLITDLQMTSRYVDYALRISGQLNGGGLSLLGNSPAIEISSNTPIKFKPTLSAFDEVMDAFEFVDASITPDQKLTYEYIENYLSNLNNIFDIRALDSLNVGARFSENGDVYFFDLKTDLVLYHDETKLAVNQNPSFFNPFTRITEKNLIDKAFLNHPFIDIAFELKLNNKDTPSFNLSSIDIKPISYGDFKISSLSKWDTNIVDQGLVKTYLLESLLLNRYFHGFKERVDLKILFEEQESIELTLRITEPGTVYLIGNYQENNIVLMEDLSYSFLLLQQSENNLEEESARAESVLTSHTEPNLQNLRPIIVPTVEYLVTNTTDNIQQPPSFETAQFPENYSYVEGMEYNNFTNVDNSYDLDIVAIALAEHGIDVNYLPSQDELENEDPYVLELLEAYYELNRR